MSFFGHGRKLPRSPPRSPPTTPSYINQSISHSPTPFFTHLIIPMDANGSYYPTYDPYGSFGSTLEPETDQSAAASVYGGGSAQSKLDDEFFDVGDWMEDDPSALMGDSAGYPQNSPHRDQVVQLSGSSLQHENSVIRESGKKEKIAFKTKSDIEILDDGFKWRKYGKKMVKNSPNPRNYYRCSVEGCPVKKRVERDKEDYMYVITTYEGTHNHEGSSKF